MQGKRIKMSNADRAKQFMPFSALKGFEYVIEEKNVEKEEKRQLDEETSAALDKKILKIKKGDMVSIVFYDKIKYRKITGVLTELNIPLRFLSVIKTKICFDDILDLD